MHTDVLICGLGPAGSAAAYSAARNGLQVVALDKKKVVGVPVQCAEFIPLTMSAYAHAAPIRVQRVDKMHNYLPSGIHTATKFSGLMLDRAAFDQALVARARTAGAQILTGHHLIKLNSQTKCATVNVAAQSLDIYYRVLVAADGPVSRIAHALGMQALNCVHARQYRVPLLQTHAATDIWLERDYRGGYAWLFPKIDTANLGLGVGASKRIYAKQMLDLLHARLIDEGRVGAHILARTGGLIPVGGLRPTLVMNDTLFVGDAAGLTHPITGAGISSAIISGERAGEAASEFLQGNSHALEDYAEDMRDQYAGSFARALQRRKLLEAGGNPARQDALLRHAWVGFNEYYGESNREIE
ncbi:MAG: NAD(P)/FAD-dependent oxidoreductase [Pseudomonadota bacterium]